jgi:hypothetical protein
MSQFCNSKVRVMYPLCSIAGDVISMQPVNAA